jgi:hypothetical protein
MMIDPRRLPHWSRVAFAARCARRVQPLFQRAWPDATAGRKAAVEKAIQLAEQSASEKRAHSGLREAICDALMVAGAAQIPHLYPVSRLSPEPPPIDADAAVVASLSAKVAEMAARAAMTDEDQSGSATHEAYHFALDAIQAAGQPGLVEVLEADFIAAKRRKVDRPWWRFW